ncbi:MAG TPA: hypothetical protein VF458_18260 [Ktedonobacteraceae bacterium]
MEQQQASYCFIVSGTLAIVGMFELVINMVVTSGLWRLGLSFGVPMVGCSIFQVIGTVMLRRNLKKQQQ